MSKTVSFKLSILENSKKTNKVDKLTLNDRTANEALQLANEIGIMQAKLNEYSNKFREKAIQAMVEQEKEENFYKTAVIPCDNGEITVTRQNKFTPLTPDCEGTLNELLKHDSFKALFTVKSKVTLKPKMVSQLIELLGEKANKFLKIEEQVLPVNDLLEQRAELRPNTNANTMQMLDRVIDLVSYKASISYKNNDDE